jgi:maltose O-acetyltransferase
MTEREKMLAGLGYDARDADLTAGRRAARGALVDINAELDEDRRMAMIGELLASFGEDSFVEPPFFCDYGANTHIGRDCFLNVNVVILDSALVTVGDRVQVGPAAQLLTADHPREASERARGVELAKPVTVGDDVWIGAAAILCPGVSVGSGAVIGAGSVVTRDIPPAVIAAGNPCQVVRELRT